MNRSIRDCPDSIDIEELRGSELFDERWYLDRYPDVKLLEMDPIEHYLWLGAQLGRSPSPQFDSQAYIAANPSIAEEGMNPLLHYLRRGRANGQKAAPIRETIPSKLNDDLDRPLSGIPHYGRTFQRKIDSARLRAQPRGASEEYDVIRSEFDVGYYLMRYPDIARATKIDPVQHYIDAGARELRNPSPHFSSKHYLARYPEVAESGLNPFYHWLTIGRDNGYIAEAFSEFDAMCKILNRDPVEVQRLLTERRQDLRARLEHGVLGEMVAKAAELDPLIAQSWSQAFQIKLPPFHSDEIVSRVVAMHRLQEAADFCRAKIVIAVNRPRWGGGRRIEGHITHALLGRYAPEDMLVVNTDESGELPSGRFPEGCRHIDFASVTANLQSDVRQRLLVEFLRSLRPVAVFNVNSHTLWNALTPYGKALSASTSIFACLFCNEQTPMGYWAGYPAKFFYRHFDVLAGVCCDSHFLADELSHRFWVPPDQRDKIIVLEAPVDATQSVATPPSSLSRRRPQIFWSGRFDRQKRVDIVYALAERMPEIDFRMWGEEVLDGEMAHLVRPGNVIVEGKYASFDELPLDHCDLWLYTSEWDGVPSLLIEVSMTGLPLVGSIAGGTGEILREGMSWRVENVEDIQAYERAIRHVLGDPAGARRRALKLREYLAERRTQDNYRETLQRILPAEEIA